MILSCRLLEPELCAPEGCREFGDQLLDACGRDRVQRRRWLVEQQDLRFDMPTIGIGTLESLRAAGGRVLAIEAGRTILVDADRLSIFAERSGVTIVSFFDDAGEALMRSAVQDAA